MLNKINHPIGHGGCPLSCRYFGTSPHTTRIPARFRKTREVSSSYGRGPHLVIPHSALRPTYVPDTLERHTTLWHHPIQCRCSIRRSLGLPNGVSRHPRMRRMWKDGVSNHLRHMSARSAEPSSVGEVSRMTSSRRAPPRYRFCFTTIELITLAAKSTRSAALLR